MNPQTSEIQNFMLTIDKSDVLFVSISLIIVFLFIPFLKEIIAAWCIRYILKIHLGDWITLPEGTGEVKVQRLTHLGIRSKSGTILWIPNSKIFQQTTHIQNKKEPFSFVLEFQIEHQAEQPLSQLVESVYQIAILSSFRSLNQEPQVKLILEQSELKLHCLCFACNEACVTPYQQFMIDTVLENTSLLKHYARPA